MSVTETTKRSAIYSFAAAVGLFCLLAAAPAMADLANGTCETTPDLVADDIVELADDTRMAGMLGIWTRRGHVDPFAGERFARKLDADPKRAGMPRRGAATQLREGKVDGALEKLDSYVAGVQKTKVVDAAAQAVADGLADDAIFLIGCINSL
jgi:hypothetical protein